MKRKHMITLRSKKAPVVELDSLAHAAYVRFSGNEVQRTEPMDTDKCVVTVDFDKSGDVVGIELLGVREFGVEALLKLSGVKGPSKKDLSNTRYVPAGLQLA